MAVRSTKLIFSLKFIKMRGRQGKQRTKVHLANFRGPALPDSIRSELVYTDYISIAPGAQVGQYVYRGNSLFDPDYTSTGHQPYYFDQIANIYSRYRVYASSIHVELMNNVGTSPVTLTVIPSTNIVTVTAGTYFEEYPRAKSAKLLGVSGYQTSQVRHRVTTTEILGLRGSQINDEDYSALTGSNPLQLWYWTIAARDLNPTNVSITLKVTLRFDCEFFDRIEVTPSFLKNENITKEDRAKWHSQDTGEPVGPYTQVVVVNEPLSVKIAGIRQ